MQSFKLNTAFGIAEINTNIVESNRPSELLTSAAVGNLFTRCQRVVRKPIRYVTIHFQDRSGAASLRCKNRAEISDPFVNRSPIRYGFCVAAQAIRYELHQNDHMQTVPICIELESLSKHDDEGVKNVTNLRI